ncbi:MAG: iron-sulfur cluster assembly scaffold protein [Alphaproteobacteria bacterium]|nr:iron-sulfur cluster assembly scaffold protein [Alphaproteobacteria bacterium]
MSEALYQKAIIDLARAAVGHGKLAAPDASVTIDNPLCGDRVSIDLSLRDGKVVELAHRVRGCALCEASASAIASHAIGADERHLAAAKDSAAAIIAGSAEDGAWPELAVFRPVREHKSRHRCVMLPFEALLKALAEAKNR